VYLSKSTLVSLNDEFSDDEILHESSETKL